MVHETRIGKATIVRNLVLAVGYGVRGNCQENGLRQPN